ncbi:hypothetical protein MKW92_014490 [Papaver armeniacum]|nr:hypothetical protein MKW92_014490 [Papaver armeniacum]
MHARGGLITVSAGKRNVKKEGASSSAGPSSQFVSKFFAMGFSRIMVLRAIDINGEKDEDAIVNTLLTYQNIENLPSEREHVPCKPECVISESSSSESVGNFLDDFSDEDTLGNEDNEGMRTIQKLKEMGYSSSEASEALERCGSDASIEILADFICAAQVAKTTDVLSYEVPINPIFLQHRDAFHYDQLKKKRPDHKRRKENKEQDIKEVDKFVIPKPMIGFGVPGHLCLQHRLIPDEASGPPYFYYENVAHAPKGTWPRISSYLFNIQPEFVNSKYFSATLRPRGYIHNLPITNRAQLMPIPPQTIFEAFPETKVWWPSWDTRIKFNCLHTKKISSRKTDKIQKDLEKCNSDPSPDLVKEIMAKCKYWNLIWIGKNKVAPLEANDIESLLGFPSNHTRGISNTARLEGLGNSFQVDTVAYHLSVLKKMYPYGITVLSLFSGIGGAEVALHRLGIRLKNVVSVECSKPRREVLQNWWKSTNQRGNLIEIEDVLKLSNERLENLIYELGGFDLVIGGSPCNNLSGSNRATRSGLDGDQSSLFFEYHRILKKVRTTMSGISRGSN